MPALSLLKRSVASSGTLPMRVGYSMRLDSVACLSSFAGPAPNLPSERHCLATDCELVAVSGHEWKPYARRGDGRAPDWQPDGGLGAAGSVP